MPFPILNFISNWLKCCITWDKVQWPGIIKIYSDLLPDKFFLPQGGQHAMPLYIDKLCFVTTYRKCLKCISFLDSEQANIRFYHLKYMLQKPQKQSLRQHKLLSLQLMSVTWWWWKGNIRQHSVFLLAGTEAYLNATMTMMCWTELIPSTLISHQT